MSEISLLVTRYPRYVLRISKLSVNLMSDCYHVKVVHTEVSYFFAGCEACSISPSLSETLVPAGLWVPHKEKLFGIEAALGLSVLVLCGKMNFHSFPLCH